MTSRASFSSLYQIEQYSIDSDLPPRLSQWLSKHQPHAIFASPHWYQEMAFFLKQLGKGHRNSKFYWLVLNQTDKPILAVPIEFSYRFGLVQLRLLSNFYSPLLDLFYDKQQLTVVDAWQLLLSAISEHWPDWLSLRAAPLTPEQINAISLNVTIQHCSAFSYQFSANYQARCETLEQYWQQRPSKLLHTLKRKSRQLRKKAHQFEITGQPTDTQIEHYWQIYQHSWKHPEPSKTFINMLFKWAADNGKLRLGFLYIEQQVVACQLWLVEDKKAYIFKLAQDISANQYSPGSLLTEYMISQIKQQDQIQLIDFLLGDDDFKALWMEHKKQIFGVEILNKQCLTGRLLHHLQQLKMTIKTLIKRNTAK